jgi:iron(III) transport system substrate-binding protein
MGSRIVSRHVVAGIAALGIALAACAAPPAAQAPAAQAEATAAPAAAKPDKLTVLCTPQEDWCQAMTKAFEEQTGIKTGYVRLSSGEALAKLRATKDNPEFSVWWGGPADGFIAANAEGLIEPYLSPSAEKVPAAQKDASGVWTGVYVGALGFCSNKDVLSQLGVEKPASWEALLDPKLKGQVAMAHPASSGTAYTTVWTQVTRLGGIDQAFEYMKKLNDNILQYTKSGSAPGQMAGRGEVAVAVIFSHDCVKFADEGMSALEVSFPSEGTGYEIGGVALVKNAPEREAAKMWIDWSLTADAQFIGQSVKSYQLPTNVDAKVSERSVKLADVKLVDYNFDEAGTNRKVITARFEDEITVAPK